MKQHDMLMFLRERYDARIEKVISCKLTDCDDEHGFIGQHIIVVCAVSTGLSQKLLVSTRSFLDWKEHSQDIIEID